MTAAGKRQLSIQTGCRVHTARAIALVTGEKVLVEGGGE
jgi:hypothetical protein